jgi:predicted nucleic acid-binding protein
LAAEPDTEFVCPKYVVVELFKHKERIVEATKLEETTLLALLHTLLERIRFFDEDAISFGSWAEAWRLCRDVDENDVAYVALTLECDGELWTSDLELEAGLRRKGFTRFFAPGLA